MMIVQKLKRSLSSDIALAEKYYALLSEVNGLALTEREIQLVAFTAVRGNMTNPNIKEDFCKEYNTTPPTINNIISKLKKLKIFVKERGIIKVNPVIVLDFKKDVVLQIHLNHA
jgi:ribosomal protein L23